MFSVAKVLHFLKIEKRVQKLEANIQQIFWNENWHRLVYKR
jgi:hypothetical protein